VVDVPTSFNVIIGWPLVHKVKGVIAPLIYYDSYTIRMTVVWGS